jgi:SAM-dependent methyltransferase
MHASVLTWAKDVISTYGLHGNVLEVGSLDVNGSLRQFFPLSIYTGIDMRAGVGVDFVMNAHELDCFADNSMDVVVCTEVLEHDDKFWLTLKEIGRVLKPQGRMILTTRSNGFQEHGYPSDFYRFMQNSVDVLLDLASCKKLQFQEDPQCSGLFILGEKIGSD